MSIQQNGPIISDISGKTNEVLSCSGHSWAPFQEDIDQRTQERNRILAHDFLKNI